LGLAFSGYVDKFIPFLYGRGDNGKTGFLQVISAIMGEYFALLKADAVIDRNGGTCSDLNLVLGPMIRDVRRLGLVDELPPEAKVKLDFVKLATSGSNQMPYREPHGKESLWPFQGTFGCCCNHLPRESDFGNYKERVVVIPFDHIFFKSESGSGARSNGVNYDPHNPHHSIRLSRSAFEKMYLKNERFLCSMLKWIGEGFRRWKEEGFNDLPARVLDAIEEYSQELDSVQQFIDDECVFWPRSDERGELIPCKKTSIKSKYKEYCKANGLAELTTKEFYERLRLKVIAHFRSQGEVLNDGWTIDRQIARSRCLQGISIANIYD
jgi:phage/plasmid-associated DNA primase